MEADGPCPGVNSMLQLGAVVYDLAGVEVDNACFNLLPLDGGVQDKGTMTWWAEQEINHPGIWDSMLVDRIHPLEAMQRFNAMVDHQAQRTGAIPVCVAYPSGYDFTWLYWYLMKYVGHSPFGFSCLDMKTLGMAVRGIGYRDATKRNYPKHWFSKVLPHTHNALDDARGQGFMFFEMLKSLGGIHRLCGRTDW